MSQTGTQTASSELTLYDLASQGRCASWSHNALKTRLLLNYKEIPYKTTWIEYPDIEPTFKSLQVQPNTSGIQYTIPTIQIPERGYVQDSSTIATLLEQLYPTPSLKIETSALSQVEDLIPKLQLSIRPFWLPLLAKGLLNDASRAYFEETRKERVGMDIYEYGEKEGKEKCWEDAEPVVRELGKLLKAKGGPFIEGETPTYADFFIVATLQMINRIDAKIFARLVEMEDSLGKVHAACKAWLKRDDH
ncbi:putative glutathione s-transferase protein [Botrytis fragariae]|uniref:Putative glutathione s-transferase protein n=1 Tax=Botrytis fragariae TaxID=1964551 RepID=A0A8H6ARF0_9HELO|nr:putative glutathione s-transferase protein [Botrytis fragariae]KAF5872244.1 putative glutathione s-transferase protein [Botrytis fragariae]